MFVNIVEMPSIRRGKEKEFRDWFEWSNAILQKSKGSGPDAFWSPWMAKDATW